MINNGDGTYTIKMPDNTTININEDKLNTSQLKTLLENATSGGGKLLLG